MTAKIVPIRKTVTIFVLDDGDSWTSGSASAWEITEDAYQAMCDGLLRPADLEEDKDIVKFEHFQPKFWQENK